MAKTIRPAPVNKVYFGIDVGGTKILAVLSTPEGQIVARKRVATPRTGQAADTVAAIETLMEDLLEESRTTPRALRGVGLAIAGMVDPTVGKIVTAPNMQHLNGLEIGARLSERFGVPVSVENDVNLGAMGEKWLGAARHAESVVGIFIGTGIGGGIIVNGRLLTGYRGVAGELGHTIVDTNGPKCGCGMHGCLESVASRTAIEREIRQAVADGKKTVLTKLIGKDLTIIKSNTLKKALEQKDKLVTGVIERASRFLGLACVNIRHMVDPQVIVVGGGVVEACSGFILPVVEKVLANDPLPGTRKGGEVVASQLGDDAVALGAVALAQMAAGKDPFRLATRQVISYPLITDLRPGHVAVAGKVYEEDVAIRADGSVKKRRKMQKKAGGDRQCSDVSAEELKRVCKGMPTVLIVGTGFTETVKLATEGRTFLRQRGIKLRTLPSDRAAEAYNATEGRKAILIHVTC